MGNRYLIVSDLHLADVEDHPDGWKSYKSSRHVFDDDFASLLRDFTAREGPGGPLTLVLGGDIFDFDLVTAVPDSPPWPVSRSERRRGLDATAGKSAWKLSRILADHGAFTAALAVFASAGHRIVYVSGNHDGEMCFPEVRQVLSDAVAESARLAGIDLPADCLRFEPWFFHVPGEVYVEHGHQHDYYSSFQHVLSPTVEAGGEPILALPMGNLSNRYLMSRMGFFNPHAADFILNLLRYLGHWLKHYAFSRRSLVVNWLVGSLVVMAKLVRIKALLRRVPADLPDRKAAVARDNAVPLATLDDLARLQEPPITHRFFRIVREFWIDRVFLALVMTVGTVTLALVPIPLWIKLMVPLSSFPALYLLYEAVVREEGVHAIGKGIPAVARAIGELLPVRVVAFGHAHRPRVEPLRGGLTFVDTGTWAPVTRMDDQRRVPGYRNYLVASFDEDHASVRLQCWDPVRPKVRVARGRVDWALCQAVRRSVFIREQSVRESEEWDGLDAASTHFLAFAGYRSVAGTARLRITPQGEARAERVAVVPAWRRQGVGRALMDAIEAEVRARGHDTLVLHAQVRAVPFYESIGYVAEGDEFEDARIPHRAMRKGVAFLKEKR